MILESPESIAERNRVADEAHDDELLAGFLAKLPILLAEYRGGPLIAPFPGCHAHLDPVLFGAGPFSGDSKVRISHRFIDSINKAINPSGWSATGVHSDFRHDPRIRGVAINPIEVVIASDPVVHRKPEPAADFGAELPEPIDGPPPKRWWAAFRSGW